MDQEYYKMPQDPKTKYKNVIINRLFNISEKLNEVRRFALLNKRDRMLKTDVISSVINFYCDLRPKIVKHSKKNKRKIYVVKQKIQGWDYKEGDRIEASDMKQNIAQILVEKGFLVVVEVGEYDDFIDTMDYYRRHQNLLLRQMGTVDDCFQVLTQFCEDYGLTETETVYQQSRF